MVDVPENVSLVRRLSETANEMLSAGPCMETESLKQDLVVAESTLKIKNSPHMAGGPGWSSCMSV